MQLLQVLAIASFVAGVAMLVIGVTQSGGGSAPATGTPVNIVATSTPTPTPTQPPSETAAQETPAVTPTPSPTPYLGAIASLAIPKLDADAFAIEEIGLLSDNSLDVPHDPHKVGWYHIYDRPGARNPANTGWTDWEVYPADSVYRGNAVFSAHKDYYPDVLGPFNKLGDLRPGDDVIVTMDNGLEYRYRVVKVNTYPANEFPGGDVIWPNDKPADVEWVTLITCWGSFIETNPNGSGEYQDRVVVVAERYQ